MRIVVIEWDGKQPPTTYYNGLHRLNLRVRGDKDKDPVVRRSRSEDHSVIVQEGTVLVESESLARQVAYLARECGARSVFVGNCEFPDDEKGRKMTKAEEEVVNRFNRAFRQRGRPAEGDREERSWVISCPECVHTSLQISDKLVIQCPSCGGLRVASRVGHRHIFSHHPLSLDEWKNMYFVEGYFEVPEVAEVGEPIKEVELFNENLEVFEGLKSSAMVNTYLVPRLNDHSIRTILNDLFSARRYYSQKDRQHPRTKMVVDLLERGVKPSKIPLIEGKEYDVLDACVIGDGENLIRQFYLSI